MAGGGPGRLQGHLALNLGGQVTWRKPNKGHMSQGAEGTGRTQPQGRVGLTCDRFPL